MPWTCQAYAPVNILQQMSSIHRIYEQSYCYLSVCREVGEQGGILIDMWTQDLSISTKVQG